MDSLNSVKKQKHIGKNVDHEEGSTEKEWTPSNENISTDSDTNQPKNRKMEISAAPRVWGEEEEIAILQGHIHYSSINNTKPSKDYVAFLTFVKDKLHTETTKTQLQAKFKTLKKKYGRNVAKRSFSKPHEEKLFKLSKKIWGKVDNAIGSSSGDLVLGGGSADDLEDWFRRNPRQLISNKDRKKMLAKSGSLKVAKAQQCLKDIQVMKEQTKLAIDALKVIPK
ncbi:hypothetical protein K7X08_037213 [Anisodus acutangulus]|uniref:Glabrous enhancer-binding protein-like DBD domain-containing protein n=1 Tax=Anisodus acutangulus TaxID=402998 RepID=A0A9Q1R9N7_9SOLA|nr:hypothetical protein K7X08_037213 [Anisodus acutangulus]